MKYGTPADLEHAMRGTLRVEVRESRRGGGLVLSRRNLHRRRWRLRIALEQPAQSAADCPHCRANRWARKRGSVAAIFCSKAQLPSLLESSVMTISKGRPNGSSAAQMAVTNGCRLSCSLWQGSTTLISMLVTLIRNSLGDILPPGLHRDKRGFN